MIVLKLSGSERDLPLLHLEPYESENGAKKILEETMVDYSEEGRAVDVDYLVCQIPVILDHKIFELVSSYPPTHTVFKSELLIYLVENHWQRRTQSEFRKTFLVYIFFLLLNCFNLMVVFPSRLESPAEQTNSWAYFTSIIVNCIIMIFLSFYLLANEIRNIIIIEENKKLLIKIKTHLSNIWNILDLLVIVSGIVAISLDFAIIFSSNKSEEHEITVQAFYSIYFFFAWIRTLDFARGFEVSSTLIRLLARVLADMAGFLLILFFIIIGMGLTSKFYLLIHKIIYLNKSEK